MLKDENLCVHCGLCAERCPTGAWDMQKSTVTVPYARDEARRASGRVAKQQKSRINDFVLKIANVNGTGSASANSLLMKTVFRMGIPVSGKNFFPSNIQGLPTWYEIRVSKDGYLGALGRSRHHGRDERADVRARPRGGCAGRRAVLRLDVAARSALVALRHRDHRRAARAHVQRAVRERAHAYSDEEHGVRRRAGRVARARPRGDRRSS